MKLTQKVLITIGREYGSGGRMIAEALGKDLDIPVFDKNMITMIAEKHGFDEADLESDDERLSNPFFEPYIAYGVDTASRSSRLYALQAQIIREEANKGSAIFVGRCADDVLQNYPCLVNIFIYAPRLDRIKRIMRASPTIWPPTRSSAGSTRPAAPTTSSTRTRSGAHRRTRTSC